MVGERENIRFMTGYATDVLVVRNVPLSFFFVLNIISEFVTLKRKVGGEKTAMDLNFQRDWSTLDTWVTGTRELFF